MNQTKQTSKLYDIAQDAIGALKILDGIDSGGQFGGAGVRRLWKSLGGVKLRRGRKPGDPKYRRRRGPKRTYAQRHADPRGCQ